MSSCVRLQVCVTSVCWSVDSECSDTDRYIHTHACANARAHSHARTHARTHTHTQSRMYIHTRARAHTETCTLTRTHAGAHTLAHTRSHTIERAHTHTHMRARTHAQEHSRTLGRGLLIKLRHLYLISLIKNARVKTMHVSVFFQWPRVGLVLFCFVLI